jgi:hypothetical protein
MNEVLHANIFFIIASLSTVIFCILISFILYHLLKIIRSLRTIIERIEAGSEMIAKDMANVRQLVTSGGLLSRALQFIMGMKGGRRRNREDD